MPRQIARARSGKGMGPSSTLIWIGGNLQTRAIAEAIVARTGPTHAMLLVKLRGPLWALWFFLSLVPAAGSGMSCACTLLPGRSRIR